MHICGFVPQHKELSFPNDTPNNSKITSHFIVTIYTQFLYCVLLKRKQMNRIKEVLEKQGRSQKWLAAQIGKSYNMVNSYVQNRRQPWY